MTQTLTHSILNDLGVPRHKDGNRLGMRSRKAMATPRQVLYCHESYPKAFPPEWKSRIVTFESKGLVTYTWQA